MSLGGVCSCREEIRSKNTLLQEMDHQCSLAVNTISEVQDAERQWRERCAQAEERCTQLQTDLQETKAQLGKEAARAEELSTALSSLERVSVGHNEFWTTTQRRLEAQVDEVSFPLSNYQKFPSLPSSLSVCVCVGSCTCLLSWISSSFHPSFSPG